MVLYVFEMLSDSSLDVVARFILLIILTAEKSISLKRTYFRGVRIAHQYLFFYNSKIFQILFKT